MSSIPTGVVLTGRYANVFKQVISLLDYVDGEESETIASRLLDSCIGGQYPSAVLRDRASSLRSKSDFLYGGEPCHISQELGLIRLLDDVEDADFGSDMFDCIVGLRILRYRVGCFRNWPLEMLLIFRHSFLNFRDRKHIILFSIVNELNIVTLLHVLEYLGPAKRNPEAKRIMRQLYYYLLAHPEVDEGAYRLKTECYESVEDAIKRRPYPASELKKGIEMSYPDHLGVIPELGAANPPRAVVATIHLEVVEVLVPHDEIRIPPLPSGMTQNWEGKKALEKIVRAKFKRVLRSITDDHINALALKHRANKQSTVTTKSEGPSNEGKANEQRRRRRNKKHGGRTELKDNE